MPADGPTIVVLAAVIERDGRLLVTRRLEGTHLSGYWEFPGGKCEPGEAHESCLEREILEELDVIAEVGPGNTGDRTRIPVADRPTAFQVVPDPGRAEGGSRSGDAMDHAGGAWRICSFPRPTAN